MGVLIIFPIAAAMAVCFKRRFELMAFPAIGLIVLTLAICGMLGILRPGVYVAALYAVPSVVLLVSRKKQIKKYVLTPGFAAFCIYMILFLIFSKDRFFISEVSKGQYAPSLLSLIRYDSLKDHMLYYDLNDPFPLGNLWSYFCVRIIGGYTDWICIFAYDIFIISGFLPLFLQIKSIKEENGLWLMMLLTVLFLPLLKMGNAYGDYDMAIPQTAAMVYTLYVLYRTVHGNDRKGDVLFAAYGFFVACTLTKYGMFVTLPLMISLCAVAFKDARRRKKLLLALGSGVALSVVFQIYNLASQEIGWKQFLYVPGCVLAALVIGAILSVGVGLYSSGKNSVAWSLFVGLAVVMFVFAVIILMHSPYSNYVREEVVEFTDKLFVGSGEEDHTIGSNVVRIYDTTFLFILLTVSGIAQKKKKNRDEVQHLWIYFGYPISTV